MTTDIQIPEETVLEVKNVGKSFSGVVALNNVSFQLEKGEIYAIVGENGAGKSTLMKIISGAYAHTSYEGKVYVSGEQQYFSSPRDSQKAGIEMIYQEISHMRLLSVTENLFMGHYLKKKPFGNVDWICMNTEAEKYLKMVGLSIDPRTMVKNLSTSQQQMLSIAKALAQNPKILILDEPTSALTRTEIEHLFEILRNLKPLGISCIYISHKLDEILELSDRVMVMRDGEVHLITRTGQVDNERLVEAIVGKSLEHYQRKGNEPGVAVLEIENLDIPHPFIPYRNILSGISFALHEREVLGLAGLVGTGRSELVSSIVHYKFKPTNGDIRINGGKINIHNPSDARKHGIAMLSEDRRVNGFVRIMDIKKNVTLADLKQISSHFVIQDKLEQKKAEIFKKKLEIKASSIDMIVGNLSGGNQQKVVLAKWLMTKPKILILDEPTRGIDVGAKREIYNIIETLSASGLGIIIISSELPELYSICDRFIILREGHVINDIPKSQISENELFIKMAGI